LRENRLNEHCFSLLKAVFLREDFLIAITKKERIFIMLKRLFGTLCLLFVISIAVFAQAGKAEIKFDKTSHNFGKFSEKQPVQKCTFTFTNTGTAPLVINQAIASCGCTVPAYTKTPILPGKKGEITVTYNGTGKFPGHFKKTITVRSNATTEMTRLQVEGDMEEAKN
jgi:lipoprotein